MTNSILTNLDLSYNPTGQEAARKLSEIAKTNSKLVVSF